MNELQKIIAAVQAGIISQAELARRTNMGRNTVYYISSGSVKNPGYTTVLNLASALDAYLAEHPEAAARLADLSTPAAA